MNRYVLLVLAVALGTAGCDKELLAGGQGEVEVTATDPPPQQPSANLSPGPTNGPSAQVAPQLFEGTVEIEATVSLVHTSGEVVDVISTPSTAVVTIGQSQPVELGRNPFITRGRYTIARITFTRVRATLTAGPGVIGTRTIDVDIGAQPRSVERLLNLVVGVTETERLNIELNSSTWILLEQTGLVDFNDFADAIGVEVVS